MNSSTSASNHRPWKRLGVILLGIAAFLAFDRGIAALLGMAEKAVYASGPHALVPKAPRGYFNTLVMGTSRAREGILPVYLHRFLGLRALSTAGQGRYPRFQYLSYQRFRRRNGPPRFIFYGVDYFIFGKQSGRADLAALGVTENPAAEPAQAPAGLERISLLVRRKARTDQMLVDLIDRLAMTLERDTSGVTPAGISDYRGLFGTVPDEWRKEPPSWEKAPFTPFPGVEGRYLEKLLREAIRDRVRVFLIYLPDFINVYRTNHLQKEFRREIRRLAARFPRVHFLDFNRPDRFPLDDPFLFVDGRFGERISHLSAAGALRFDRMLARSVSRHLRKAPGMNR